VVEGGSGARAGALRARRRHGGLRRNTQIEAAPRGSRLDRSERGSLVLVLARVVAVRTLLLFVLGLVARRLGAGAVHDVGLGGPEQTEGLVDVLLERDLVRHGRLLPSEPRSHPTNVAGR
jgi:hypothetical protein